MDQMPYRQGHCSCGNSTFQDHRRCLLVDRHKLAPPSLVGAMNAEHLFSDPRIQVIPTVDQIHVVTR
jgi:hypothetical protein